MGSGLVRPRLNIYLDDPHLQEYIKIAAARRRVSLSAYCLQAIRQQLAEDGILHARPEEEHSKAQAAARRLDHLRGTVGPVGIPVSQLIAEGRHR